jgi:ABC-type nickel/cobalt efflux system permease component RcnA
MSHGVHAVQHEVEHQIEHEAGGHGGGRPGGHDSQNRRIALVIAVLALFLAFSETLGKSAQTAALNSQIESSDLWNFFQAKNIRRTVTIVATESAKLDQATTGDEARKAALAKQIDEWTKTAARYRSEPEAAHGLGEGTVELARRAKEKEEERNLSLNKYHYFEFASAALQIGIVLCSAAVITGMMALVWLAGGVGVIGLALMAMGLFLPHVHLLPGTH